MTQSDRAEIRQMLTDVLQGTINQIEGKLEVIHVDLKFTKNQTVRTNGRVNELENEVGRIKMREIQHVAACPNTARLKSLEDKEISRKAVVKFLALASAVGGGVAGLVVSIMQLIF